MSPKISFVICSSLILGIACSPKEDKALSINSPIVIKVKKDLAVNLLADSLVKNGRMVVLELAQSSFIQNASVLKILKNGIYVLDKDLKKIFAFDSNGKFNYIIDGKRENYPDFVDIGIDTFNNEILALALSEAVMYRYKEGRFVSQKHCGFWTSEFTFIEGDSILFYQGFVNDKLGKNDAHLLFTDSVYNLLRKALPIKGKVDIDFAFKFGVAEFHFFRSDNVLNVLKEDSYEVYRYPAFDSPKYKFDFGVYEVKNYSDVDSLSNNAISAKYAMLTDFWETKNTIAFIYSLGNKRTMCYYNKLSGRIIQVYTGDIDNIFNFLAYYVKGVYENEFYGQIPGEAIPFVIKNLEKKINLSEPLDDILRQLKSIKKINGKYNPVLVFFGIKDF